MTGRRAKSIGTTTVAGAIDSAVVRQKCASRPAQPTRTEVRKACGGGQGDVAVKASSDQAKHQLDCCEIEQDTSDRVVTGETFGQQNSKGKEDGGDCRNKQADFKRLRIRAGDDQYPDKAQNGGKPRIRVIFSPSRRGARITTQSGEVNSSAKTWANGITATA